MNENMLIKETNSDQCYVRLIRYLRKQQEAERDETSHIKETYSNKPE